MEVEEERERKERRSTHWAIRRLGRCKTRISVGEAKVREHFHNHKDQYFLLSVLIQTNPISSLKQYLGNLGQAILKWPKSSKSWWLNATSYLLSHTKPALGYVGSLRHLPSKDESEIQSCGFTTLACGCQSYHSRGDAPGESHRDGSCLSPNITCVAHSALLSNQGVWDMLFPLGVQEDEGNRIWMSTGNLYPTWEECNFWNLTICLTAHSSVFLQ